MVLVIRSDMRLLFNAMEQLRSYLDVVGIDLSLPPASTGWCHSLFADR